MLDIALFVALMLVCVAGVLLTVLQLPGLWVIAAAVIGYGWYYDWVRVAPLTVGILLGVAVSAEIFEQITGLWFTRKSGGSRRASWWALAGGIAGAFLLSVPIFGVGTIIGSVIGCFIGALLAELSLEKTTTNAVKVGMASAVGRAVGSTFKIAAAMVMFALSMVSAISN